MDNEMSMSVDRTMQRRVGLWDLKNLYKISESVLNYTFELQSIIENAIKNTQDG